MSTATEAEIRVALESLSTADLVRLEKAGRYLVSTFGAHANRYDWEELLNEAIVRTLEDKRSWKKKVDFPTFLVGAMKSIRSSWAKTGSRTVLRDLSDTREAPAEEPDAVASVERAERQQERAEVAKRILRLFADDAHASQVLSGWQMGMKGPEIQETSGMSAKEFQAAVRRIRRSLDREENLNARAVLDA